jgi:hypothetical protein
MNADIINYLQWTIEFAYKVGPILALLVFTFAIYTFPKS